MREEDIAEVGNWASWGTRPRLCVSSKESEACRALGMGGRRGGTVQAWPSCGLLLGDMDTIAVQVLGEEEVGHGLGHPGLKGK